MEKVVIFLPKPRDGLTFLIIRSSARLFGALLLAMVFWLLTVDWPRYTAAPPLPDTAQFLALFTAVCGFVLIWWREGLGGLVALGGALWSFAVGYVSYGDFATCPVLLCLPGVLALVSWWRIAARSQVSPLRTLLKKPFALAIVLLELAAAVFLGAAILWEGMKMRPMGAPLGLQYRPRVLGGPVPVTDEVRHRGYLGILVDSASSERAKSLGVESAVVVTGVRPGSTAETSGVLAGDVVVKIDSFPVKTPSDLADACAQRGPNETVRLHLLRKKGVETEEVIVDIPLMTWDAISGLLK